MAFTVAMWVPGLSTWTSDVVRRSAPVTSAGPRTSMRIVTGVSESLEHEVLQIQDDVAHVLLDTGEERELVESVVEAHLGDSSAGDRRQKGCA